MNRAKILRKLLIEHEKQETPKQEKEESKRTQMLEKTLKVEKKVGGKVKKRKK
jgi:hypothetical protein